MGVQPQDGTRPRRYTSKSISSVKIQSAFGALQRHKRYATFLKSFLISRRIFCIFCFLFVLFVLFHFILLCFV